MRTGELLDRLQRHYIKPGEALPGGIFLPEVGWNGKQGAGSRADALYVGFTSTSGRILVGHELKTSRADWLRELEKSGKADPWCDQCHAWYVVAPSTDVVPVEEVPAGWGLLVVSPRTRTRLTVKVKAAVRADHTPSWEAVRSIMARQDRLRAQAIGEIRKTADTAAYAKLEKRVQQHQETRERRQDDVAAEKLRAVEEALGCTFEDWRNDNYVRPEEFRAALQIAKARRSLTDTWSGLPGAIDSLAATSRQLAELRDQLAVIDA